MAPPGKKRTFSPLLLFNALLSGLSLWGAVSAAAVAVLLPLEKRRDASDNHTPVPAFRPVRWDKQELLAVALGYKVFSWHAELLRQHIRDPLRPSIREAQIIHIRADGVGVAFDEEDFAGIPV